MLVWLWIVIDEHLLMCIYVVIWWMCWYVISWWLWYYMLKRNNHSLKWQRWLVTIAWNDSDDWYWIWWHDVVSRVWVDVMMLYPMTGWADTMLYPVSAGHDAVSRVWLWFRHDGVFHVWLYYCWHDVVSHARLTWCCFPCLVWHDAVSHAQVLYSNPFMWVMCLSDYVSMWYHCIT